MEDFEESLGVAGLFTDRINRFLDGIADEIKQSLSDWNSELMEKL